ncbi:threonine ammonia-lyase [Shimazuella alba]|uniref:threonine ammonia-lyase n=1 Tax=Shimazuella alba TaxID=2690964 RepID=A0A6I4VSD1_9BACL|nr:pyridoxal-phosphate dependent enzyme [Shimazuella alba]MXQ53923.1 pyridoxal-phosphate dependent enzyme [Shimazuella alba]
MHPLDVTYDHIREAKERIREFVNQSSKLAAVTGAKSIWFKEENFQRTGAFKIRGVMSRMLLMTPEERQKGVVTASCGNHGLAVTYVAKLLGIPSWVVVPAYTISEKRVGILRNGGELLEHGTTYDEAEVQAQKLARENDWYLIHESEDPAIIAGHGTIGLEMLEGEENLSIDILIVPAGGGALLSGLSIAAKSIKKDIRIIGVQSVASPPWYYSLHAGEIVSVTYEESFGGRTQRRYRPKMFRYREFVEEPHISMAMAWLYEEHNLNIEGSAAVGVAALLAGCIDVKEKNVATILSGRNVDAVKFEEIITKFGKLM